MSNVIPLDLPFITPDKGLIICSTSEDFDKCMGDKTLTFLLGNTDDYQPHYSSYDEWKNK